MSNTAQTHQPSIGLGVTAVALGAVGLLLLFLPVLSVPLSVLGLAFGLGGLWAGFVGGPRVLRWAIGGTLVSAIALALSLAIVYAPAGLLAPRNPAVQIPGPPEPHYVSPPARP